MARPGGRHRAWEATLLAAHFAVYLSAVFFVLSPVKAVVFILVQQGLLGSYAQALRHLDLAGKPTRPLAVIQPALAAVQP